MVQKYKKLSIVAKASLWSFFAGLVQRGISILTIPIFTRILSTDEFAQYTLYQSWHDILVIFISLYVFNYAVYSGLKEFEDDSNGFIATTQTLITGLCLLCFSIYYIIHIFIGDIIGFPIHIIILMFFDMLFFSAFNVWAAKERYEFRYKLMTILSILIGILGPIIGLIFIRYFPNKGYGRIYGVAIANIFFGFFIYIYGFIKSKNKFDKKYIKFLLAYCLPLIPHFLASNVLTRFDRIMIGEMCSIAEAGIYGLAYSLSCFTQLVNDSILKSLTPLTYKLIKDNKNTNLLKKTTNYLVLFVAIVNILLILFAPEAIKIFATKEYYQAVYIIPSVTASVYFMFLYNLFANIEYYYKETKYIAKASIGAAIINVILNIIFIRIYGFIAAGYTTLISYILYCLGHYIFMKKVCKKHANGYNYYDYKCILSISIAFVLGVFLIIPLYQNIIARYLLIFIILTVIALNYKKIKVLLNKTE